MWLRGEINNAIEPVLIIFSPVRRRRSEGDWEKNFIVWGIIDFQ